MRLAVYRKANRACIPTVDTECYPGLVCASILGTRSYERRGIFCPPFAAPLSVLINLEALSRPVLRSSDGRELPRRIGIYEFHDSHTMRR